jgi:hypothetical protein
MSALPLKAESAGKRNVRFGSKVDIEARPRNVRLTPESGH